MTAKIDWYREVLELEPNSKVFFPLARLVAEEGNREEAMTLLERGLSRHPEYLEARLFRIELLFQEGRREECNEEIARLSKMFASYAGFWQAWAACLASDQEQSDTASLLRFLAAHFVSGPLRLHDVLNAGLDAMLKDRSQAPQEPELPEAGPIDAEELPVPEQDIAEPELSGVQEAVSEEISMLEQNLPESGLIEPELPEAQPVNAEELPVPEMVSQVLPEPDLAEPELPEAQPLSAEELPVPEPQIPVEATLDGLVEEPELPEAEPINAEELPVPEELAQAVAEAQPVVSDEILEDLDAELSGLDAGASGQSGAIQAAALQDGNDLDQDMQTEAALPEPGPDADILPALEDTELPAEAALDEIAVEQGGQVEEALPEPVDDSGDLPAVEEINLPAPEEAAQEVAAVQDKQLVQPANLEQAEAAMVDGLDLPEMGSLEEPLSDVNEADEQPEEQFSLRTRSMAEVLAEQGDIQGALDIYAELAEAATSTDEVEDINRRIATLKSRLEMSNASAGFSSTDANAAERNREKLMGMLEALAQRVEARAQ